MKLLTYREEGIFSGIAVSQFHEMYKVNVDSYKSRNSSESDYFIPVGNGNASTGRILLNRENPPSIEKSKIYSADLWIPLKNPIEDIYLREEGDILDNRLYIKLIDVEDLYIEENGKQLDLLKDTFHSQDEYVVKLQQNQSVFFIDLFTGDEVRILNQRDRVRTPISLTRKGNTFLIS